MLKRLIAGACLAAIALLTQAASLVPTATLSFGGTAVPTFPLACGSYSGTQSVSLVSATPNATIYYTINGTTPTTTLYTAPIPVATTTTVNALAVSHLGQSAITTCQYVISGASIRAPAGHLILSGSILGLTGSYGLPEIEAQMDAAFSGGSSLTGYMLYAAWAAMQTGNGTYNFTVIDGARNYEALHYPTKTFNLVLYHEDFFHPNPGSAVPANILGNAAFGPGFTGHGNFGFGYWQNLDGVAQSASLAAYWRTAVLNQVVQFAHDWANHVWLGAGNTGGWTYNTDPNFVSFTPIEESAAQTGTGAQNDATLTQSVFNTNWVNMEQQVAAQFSQVTILNSDNYGAGVAETQPDSVTRINAAAALNVSAGNQQIAFSGPDVFIRQSLYVDGQLSYLGLASGSTRQTANMPWYPRIETGSTLQGEDPHNDATVTLAGLFNVVHSNGGKAIFWGPGYIANGAQQGYTVGQIQAFAAANPF